MRNHFVLLAITTFFAIGCTNEADDTQAATTADTGTKNMPAPVAEKPAIVLDTFVQIPDTILGCSGMYAADSTAMYENRYLFFTDLQHFLMLQKDGKVIYLKQESNSNKNEVYTEVYKGEGYRMTLTKEVTRQTGDEVWEVKGEAIIEHANETTTINIYGQEGC